MSSNQVKSIKNISIEGLLVDPIPNSPNSHDKNCSADSEENY